MSTKPKDGATEREMTLDEFVGQLPDFHIASTALARLYRENDEQDAELARLQSENERLREVVEAARFVLRRYHSHDTPALRARMDDLGKAVTAYDLSKPVIAAAPSPDTTDATTQEENNAG